MVPRVILDEPGLKVTIQAADDGLWVGVETGAGSAATNLLVGKGPIVSDVYGAAWQHLRAAEEREKATQVPSGE